MRNINSNINIRIHINIVFKGTEFINFQKKNLLLYAFHINSIKYIHQKLSNQK